MLRIALFSLVALACGSQLEGDTDKEKRNVDPGLSLDYHSGLGLSDPSLAYGGGRLLSQLVAVQNNVAVAQPVGVPHPVPVPLPVAVPQPLPVQVPVPVPVVKTISVPVEKPVPYPLIRKVPVEVIRKVPVPVYKPYPVKVPIYKTRNIYYDVIPKHHHGW